MVKSFWPRKGARGAKDFRILRLLRLFAASQFCPFLVLRFSRTTTRTRTIVKEAKHESVQ